MRWIIVVTVLASAATAQVPPKYPVAAFGALPFIQDPEISPDGMAVAAKVVVDGEQQLAILSLTSGRSPVVAKFGRTDLSWYSWVNDDRLIAGVAATDMFQGRPIRVTRLVSFPRNGGPLLKLGWNDTRQIGDDVIWISPERKGSTVLIESGWSLGDAGAFWPRVDSVDVVTGKTEEILRGLDGVSNWYADQSGIVRLGYGFGSGTGRRLLYRRDGSSLFRTIDRVKFEQDKHPFIPVHFTDDPAKLIVRSDHDDRAAIYEYDVTTNKIGPLLFGDPRYDVGATLKSPNGSSIMGVYVTDDRRHIVWLDPDMKMLQADLDKSVPGRFANVVSMDAKASRMVVEISSPMSPQAYWIMDQATGHMTRFADAYPDLRRAALAPMRAISYKARDGLEITAYLTLPAGREAKALPLIVLPHGGPAERDSLGFDYIVQFLANRGYAVLQPNYRGSTGYGNAFADRGEGQWGLAMQDDLADAAAWAASHNISDAKRTCIMGLSYGGYAALQGVVRDPAVYRCAVAFAGVSDLSAQTRYYGNFLGGREAKRRTRLAAPDFAAVSPVNFASKIGAPVLLIHGKLDTTVPYDQSVRMNRALQSAGKTVEFLLQPQGDHHLSRQADRIEFLTRVEAFLAKYNPAD